MMSMVLSFREARILPCARTNGSGKETLTNNLEMSQTQRERLAFLELRGFFTGELRRADLEARLGIKPAAASRDLCLYREIAPENIDDDAAARCYRPSAASAPVFGFQPERVLSWLLKGFGYGLEAGCAVRRAGALSQVQHASAWSGHSFAVRKAGVAGELSVAVIRTKRREIVPVALADNGFRWHIRAYDRERNRFSDFVLTRISKVSEIEAPVAENEALQADEQWARIVDLELVPHPGIAWPKAVEADYGMQDGILKIKTRAALAGNVLRRWSIDSTPDHGLDAASHHLWLRNPQSLYGLESAAMAPGFAAAVN